MPERALTNVIADGSSDPEKASLSSRSIGGNVEVKGPETLLGERHQHGASLNVEPAPGGPTDGSELREHDDAPGDLPLGVLSSVVSRVLSRASVRSEIGPPPDGGRKAWIIGKSKKRNDGRLCCRC